MEYKISRADLAKTKKDYEFDMGKISDKQWMDIASNIIAGQEDSLKEKLNGIDNSFVGVKFKESNSCKSAIARVVVQYERTNEQVITIYKNFDAEGVVGENNRFLNEVWNEVVYTNKNNFTV